MNKIILDPKAYDFDNGYLQKLIAAGSARSAADAAFCYEFGGKDDAHAKLAADIVAKTVADYKASIAAGAIPSLARDSYLYAGPAIENLLLTYDWCGDFLSDDLKTDILDICNQCVYNIFNPTLAIWGGKLHKWSGWANNDPENNYYFSFCLAAVLLALVQPAGSWIDYYVKDTIIPRLEKFYSSHDGGGSCEGTGYGAAVERMYRVTRLLKDSLGIEMPGVTKHATETIHYMIHASKPGLKKLANIGDQPREHDNKIDDPDEVVVLEAMAICDDEPTKALGRWWLDNNGEVFDRKDLYRFACLDRRGERIVPTELVYHAKTVGHLFARTSWEDPLASWICVTCGPQKQVHDSRDQGGITFHSGGLSLAEGQNKATRTGINQTSLYGNVMVFRDEKGAIVEQNRTGVGLLSYYLADGCLYAVADASPAFSTIKWKRFIFFVDGAVRVFDKYEIPAGYSATHQINTPTLPLVVGDEIFAGNLHINILGEFESINIIDWKALSPTENPNGGYKIEIVCKGGELNIDWADTSVGTAPFPMPVEPEPEPTTVPIEQFKALSEKYFDLQNEYQLLASRHTEDVAEFEKDIADQNVKIAEIKTKLTALAGEI